MQIVRDLAGYTMGRSDLVRRAMSKKKQSVMEKERHNFVYGNPEENVPGCVSKGIPEKIASDIYDTMMDFAKYAFNKSHAACYAFVAFQTAFLKCYYPVEFMAALMTSVLDNTGKVSQYILASRQMGIEILPPDINEGEGVFSADGSSIRYGLSAIKSLGRPVIEAIVEERSNNGRFTDIKDFASRLSGREVNKRTVESFIKSGAFDSFGLTRKQMMLVYSEVMDSVAQEKKESVSGQMSLFDMFAPEEKPADVVVPDVGEFNKDELLAMEKEVLGIYVSGHPIDEYKELWEKNITNMTSDFELDEETGAIKVEDKGRVIVGGIITDIKVRMTKKGQSMAYLTLEDLVGTVEVIVFPKPYQEYRKYITVDNKIFVAGDVDQRVDENGKVRANRIIPFDAIPRDIWIKFTDKQRYVDSEKALFNIVSESDGHDRVIIYCEAEKVKKILPPSMTIQGSSEILDRLRMQFGAENVKVVEKTIEK